MTFAYTGGPQTYTVPANVTSLQVDAAGASGGTYSGAGGTNLGGPGVRVQATLAVTPGEVLTVYVGGAGSQGGAGGYNGGGNGLYAGGRQGGGGGGRRSATAPSTSLAERLLVAAGGGGGVVFQTNGGGGGAPDGADGGGLAGSTPGTGATQTAGGNAGGTLGQGGAGVYSGAGGGGGGYYGGGGSNGPYGGGGGSSYAGASTSLVSYTQGYRSGDGYVTISVTPPANQPAPYLDGSNISGGVIKNQTALQVGANFNIDGNGTMGSIAATTGELIRVQGAHLQWNRTNGDGATWLLNQKGGGNGGIRFGASDAVSSGTNTLTEWARFDGSGNLGLGTPTPGQKLDVAGSATVSGNTTVGGTLTAGSAVVTGLTTDGIVTTTAGVLGSSTAASFGTSFIQNTTTPQASSNFNVSGTGTVGGTLTATNAVITGALTGTGAPGSRLSVNGSMNVTNSSGSFSVNDYDASHTTVLLGTFTGAGANGPQLRFVGGGSGGSFMDVGQNANGDFVVEGNDSPRLTVLNGGNVGIGITNPVGGLQVLTGNGGVVGGVSGAVLSGAPGANPNLELRGSSPSTAVTPYIDFAETNDVDYTTRLRSISGVLNVEGNGSSGLLFKVNGNVQATNVTYTSDARFKQNVRPLTGALASVLALRGVRYEWNALGIRYGGMAGAPQVGLLAQELEKVYPELVSTDKDGYKAVNYAQLTPVLLEALKELAARNAALEAKATALEGRAAQAEADAGAAKAQAAQATATLETFEARLRRLEAGSAQAQR